MGSQCRTLQDPMNRHHPVTQDRTVKKRTGDPIPAPQINSAEVHSTVASGSQTGNAAHEKRIGQVAVAKVDRGGRTGGVRNTNGK